MRCRCTLKKKESPLEQAPQPACTVIRPLDKYQASIRVYSGVWAEERQTGLKWQPARSLFRSLSNISGRSSRDPYGEDERHPLWAESVQVDERSTISSDADPEYDLQQRKMMRSSRQGRNRGQLYRELGPTNPSRRDHPKPCGSKSLRRNATEDNPSPTGPDDRIISHIISFTTLVYRSRLLRHWDQHYRRKENKLAKANIQEPTLQRLQGRRNINPLQPQKTNQRSHTQPIEEVIDWRGGRECYNERNRSL